MTTVANAYDISKIRNIGIVAHIDAAGLCKITFAAGAPDGFGLIPERERTPASLFGVRALVNDRRHGPRPVLQRVERFRPGHAFDLDQPIEASAPRPAAVTIEMIWVDAA